MIDSLSLKSGRTRQQLRNLTREDGFPRVEVSGADAKNCSVSLAQPLSYCDFPSSGNADYLVTVNPVPAELVMNDNH